MVAVVIQSFLPGDGVKSAIQDDSHAQGEIARSQSFRRRVGHSHPFPGTLATLPAQAPHLHPVLPKQAVSQAHPSWGGCLYR